MFWLIYSLFVSVIVCDNENSTEKFLYNSSDLSYLSNGIQFPVSGMEIRALKQEDTPSNVFQIQWFTGLYDHHKWWNNLEGLSAECRNDMTVYLRELINGTYWANKSK